MFPRVAQNAKPETEKCDSSCRNTFQALVKHFELVEQPFSHSTCKRTNDTFGMSHLGQMCGSIWYSMMNNSFFLHKDSIVHCGTCQDHDLAKNQ